MSNETITREQAAALLEAAIKEQSTAKARLAMAVQMVATEKANVMDADGKVLQARANLARLGGPIRQASNNGNGGGDSQSKVLQGVISVLRTAGPEGMTLDEVYNALVEHGVEMAGAKPRENLTAYIGRWSKAGTGIVSVSRGRYGFKQADVPSFLAPVAGVATEANPADGKHPVEVVNHEAPPDVPAFLAPTGGEQTNEDPGTPLPTNFPGYLALAEAGLTTRESLAGKTQDQLRRVKGVGAQTARDILAALEA